MLIIKNQTVINCLQLLDTKTSNDDNDVISEKLVQCIFILKTWQGENDGYSWKH